MQHRSFPFRGWGSALLVPCICLYVLLSGTGCFSSSKINHEASTGQQLQDLEKSYKDGIISEKEYQRLKQAIIRKND